MSSCDGYTLESWIVSSFFGNKIQALQLLLVVKLFDQNGWRESVENAIDDFDEETQSWRDYRNSMWYTYEKETDKPIEVITGITDPCLLAIMYLFPEYSKMQHRFMARRIPEQGNSILIHSSALFQELQYENEPKFRELFMAWWKENIDESKFEHILKIMA